MSNRTETNLSRNLKVKQLIRDQSEMSTSQCAIDALTQKVVQECRKAIENVKVAGRKTVMGRDIK